MLLHFVNSERRVQMADLETGPKWWLRYVVVPIFGGAGIIGIIIAFILKPATPPLPSTAPSVVAKPVTPSEGSQAYPASQPVPSATEKIKSDSTPRQPQKTDPGTDIGANDEYPTGLTVEVGGRLYGSGTTIQVNKGEVVTARWNIKEKAGTLYLAQSTPDLVDDFSPKKPINKVGMAHFQINESQTIWVADETKLGTGFSDASKGDIEIVVRP